MGKEIDFQSPFFKERMKEWEEFKILRVWKETWETSVEKNFMNAVSICEKEMRNILKDEYEVTRCLFNYEEKNIYFNFEFEEIIL